MTWIQPDCANYGLCGFHRSHMPFSRPCMSPIWIITLTKLYNTKDKQLFKLYYESKFVIFNTGEAWKAIKPVILIINIEHEPKRGNITFAISQDPLQPAHPALNLIEVFTGRSICSYLGLKVSQVWSDCADSFFWWFCRFLLIYWPEKTSSGKGTPWENTNSFIMAVETCSFTTFK